MTLHTHAHTIAGNRVVLTPYQIGVEKNDEGIWEWYRMQRRNDATLHIRQDIKKRQARHKLNFNPERFHVKPRNDNAIQWNGAWWCLLEP